MFYEAPTNLFPQLSIQDSQRNLVEGECSPFRRLNMWTGCNQELQKVDNNNFPWRRRWYQSLCPKSWWRWSEKDHLKCAQQQRKVGKEWWNMEKRSPSRKYLKELRPDQREEEDGREYRVYWDYRIKHKQISQKLISQYRDVQIFCENEVKSRGKSNKNDKRSTSHWQSTQAPFYQINVWQGNSDGRGCKEIKFSFKRQRGSKYPQQPRG